MTMLKAYFMEIATVCVPATIVFLCFKPYRMRALVAMGLRSTRKREIALILFVNVIFGILALTLWPVYIWEESPGLWGNLRILIDRPTWKSNLSLVPFSVFGNYFEDLAKGPAMFFATLINFLGNLAIFIPMGLFPPLLFSGVSWKRVAFIGLAMSCLIEVLQYFIMRNTAVDDIILNTAGTMCGYVIYLLIRKKFPKVTTSFLCQKE